MRDLIDLVEAPVGDFTLHGDFTGSGGFKEPDRKLLTSPKARDKIRRVLHRAPVEIDLHFVNKPDLWHLTDAQWMTSDELYRDCGVRIEPKPNAINLVFRNNHGDEAVPMTGWIIAHRMSHAFSDAKVTNSRIYGVVYNTFRELAARCVIDTSKRDPLSGGAASDLAAILGTTKAARDNNLTQFGEWYHDSFAQYLVAGRISILSAKDARTVSSKYSRGEYKLRPDVDPDAIDRAMSLLISKMEKAFANMLERHVGPMLLVF